MAKDVGQSAFIMSYDSHHNPWVPLGHIYEVGSLFVIRKMSPSYETDTEFRV